MTCGRGFYPEVRMGEGQWRRVVDALRRTGRKDDARIAERLESETSEPRRRHEGRG